MTPKLALRQNQSRFFNDLQTHNLPGLQPVAYQTEVLRGGLEVIEKIFDEWSNLCDEVKQNEPFFRPEWFLALVKNFNDEALLFTVRRNGKLRAVLPLTKKKANLHGVPVKKLQGLFNLQSQRFDLIHSADEGEKEAILQSLWEKIKAEKDWQVFEVRLVKADSWLGDLLKLAEKENHQTGVWQMDGAPFTLLPQGDDKEKEIEEYVNRLSKNRRKLIKKHFRLLEEAGKLEVRCYSRYSEEVMERYFDLEAKSWKNSAGTAVVCDPRSENLHRDFAKAMAEKKALLFHELCLDGKTIAMYISIIMNGKSVGWKTSYNEEYARFSPGNLIFFEYLKCNMRHGSTEIDHLSPSTYNKRLWADGEREHVAFYVFQRGFAGFLLSKWKFTLIDYLRKFKKKTDKTANVIF